MNEKIIVEFESNLTAMAGEIERLRGLSNELEKALKIAEEMHRKEVTELRDEYLSCQSLVANMHKAAMGEITGPVRGVVEDVADVRAELESLKTLRETDLEHIQSLQNAVNTDNGYFSRFYQIIHPGKGWMTQNQVFDAVKIEIDKLRGENVEQQARISEQTDTINKLRLRNKRLLDMLLLAYDLYNLPFGKFKRNHPEEYALAIEDEKYVWQKIYRVISGDEP